MKTLFAILLTVMSLGIFTTTIVKSVNLTQNCTGYLERASNANSVETAIKELNRAIDYLDENDITSGYTSVLWRTPDDDIDYWYQNIVSSRDELLKVTEETTALEKTNLLMKLRETLTDNGEKGTHLTYPDGLSRYPNNVLWGWLLWFASFGIIFAIGLWIMVLADNDILG